ncbi:transposase [Spirillospora sp. NPDC050679]
MARGEVIDAEWELIEPHLPLGVSGPVPDLRGQFNAVMWRFRTGCPWRDVPEGHGNWSTVYDRFRAWARAGVFADLMDAMVGEATARGEVDLSLVSVDSTVCRAHHHAAGTAIAPERLAVLERAVAAEKGLRRRDNSGRRTGRPASKGAGAVRLGSRANRAYLRRRHIKAVIPDKADQAADRKNKGRRGGRPISHDTELYTVRNTVKRCINKLKECRGPATRYDKTPDSYLAGLHLRGSIIWLRSLPTLP